MDNVIKDIIERFKEYSPNEVVGSIANSGTDYIVYLTRLGIKDGEFVTDNEYVYNPKNMEIKPFRVTDDPQKYARAMRHVIYRRGDI